MTEPRKMTIARGLTRLKTIKAQLEGITNNIRSYGAWNDKRKHPLGDTTHNDIKKNHAQARDKVQSLYQQFHDLTNEYIKIKRAIDVANMTTNIEIGGKVLSLHQAMLYEREVAGFTRGLVNAYVQSVSNADREVKTYNSQYTSLPEEAKATLISDISYLVGKGEIEKLDTFTIQFLTEIDGIKNEINAVTEIILD